MLQRININEKINLIKKFKLSSYVTDESRSKREANMYWRACASDKTLCDDKVKKILAKNKLEFAQEKENSPNYSPKSIYNVEESKNLKESIFNPELIQQNENIYASKASNAFQYPSNQKYSRYLVSPVPMQDYGIYYPNGYSHNYNQESFFNHKTFDDEPHFDKGNLYSKYPSYSGEPRINICAHCGTSTTSLWRKLEKQDICNACALYYKLHNKKRPENLLKTTIRRRKRQKKNYKLNE